MKRNNHTDNEVYVDPCDHSYIFLVYTIYEREFYRFAGIIIDVRTDIDGGRHHWLYKLSVISALCVYVAREKSATRTPYV